jgi:RimJ/RimL family protein N-acetyltransferase
MNPASMPEEIATGRLLLRPYSLEDVAAVFAHATDAEWAKFLPLPDPYLRRNAEEFIAAQILLDRVVHASWAVVAGNELVGGINIRFQFANRIGAIGYSIGRPFWARGYATEAAHAVVTHAFRTHAELNRVRAMTALRNVASQRVLSKVGFTREGILRQNRVVRGVPVDEVWFGLLRSEWSSSEAGFQKSTRAE